MNKLAFGEFVFLSALLCMVQLSALNCTIQYAWVIINNHLTFLPISLFAYTLFTLPLVHTVFQTRDE